MDIVIIGGGYAGVACALRLAHRARRQGTAARIRLIHPAPVLVERIRLHQAATGQGLRERRIGTLLRRSGVELVQGWAEAIDPQERAVHVGGQQFAWDRLVLAIGSRSGSDEVPGVAEHAHTLNPATAPALRERLQALPRNARVLVVGGGLTGIEAASEVAESFPRLEVSLATEGRLVDDFSPAGRDHILHVMRKLRVDVHEGVRVHSVSAARLETDSGALAFDLCVWAAGFALPPLAWDAGLRVNAHGQVLVDPQLRSVSHPWIYAAGDIAAPVLPPGQTVPMGCKSAMPMGAHVGDNLARELRGEPGEAFDYALLFYCVSLGRRDGLIQWADDEGRLTGRILTGRRGAWFKEMICRSTWWALLMESRGTKAVVWKRTGRAPQAMPRAERAPG
ncbi:MAG TPA: FAD-dependent oxidoreductase [Ramlibacter sp.]|uniref:NAD(P)/FAD-dependent oxidoreductase n=1 Tax=Ramlibacter sp. TaxID=1917967 RepID=UPI002ECFFE39